METKIEVVPEKVDVLRQRIISGNRKDYEQNSGQKLADSIVKRMTTIMIGAIAATESRIGHLWGAGKRDEDLSAEELEVLPIWREIRKAILDNGGKQVREMERDLREYVISWKGISNG